ncbi:hypothetical protein M8818_002049 [Zalaria obscura]|uniref:Uncharacterized protein n=1 Tax=Zalaria obscura TaxID=2024903 RepID=A0ACC3SM08_9PEZI
MSAVMDGLRGCTGLGILLHMEVYRTLSQQVSGLVHWSGYPIVFGSKTGLVDSTQSNSTLKDQPMDAIDSNRQELSFRASCYSALPSPDFLS